MPKNNSTTISSKPDNDTKEKLIVRTVGTNTKEAKGFEDYFSWLGEQLAVQTEEIRRLGKS